MGSIRAQRNCVRTIKKLNYSSNRNTGTDKGGQCCLAEAMVAVREVHDGRGLCVVLINLSILDLSNLCLLDKADLSVCTVISGAERALQVLPPIEWGGNAVILPMIP